MFVGNQELTCDTNFCDNTRLPKDKWKTPGRISVLGIDIPKFELDFTKCETCGGKGSYFKEINNYGRKRLTTCPDCNGDNNE